MDVEKLIARLAEPNPLWREHAEHHLCRLGEAAVPPLISALAHGSAQVRVHAAQVLGRLQAARAVEPLAAALSEGADRGALAIAAEKALVAIGAAALPALLRVATQGDPRTAARALRAVGLIGERSDDVERTLRASFAASDSGVRTQAAAAWCELGLSTDEVAPLLSDADKWVRYLVAEAMAKRGDERARPVLEAAAADDEEPWLPSWAEDLLAELP